MTRVWFPTAIRDWDPFAPTARRRLPSPTMVRVFSGIQPTGEVHLGNFLGALRRWVVQQDEADCTFCIVDLHAVTVPQEPGVVAAKTLDVARILLAVGIDPERSTLFVQSHVAEHAQLTWLMECTAAFGDLRRMTQFKEKGDDAEFVSAALFTYPALQAADILLHDTGRVPVGDDQRQHLELARDIAVRFNGRYGDTFVVPEHVIPPAGARVMDLQSPTRKMSKSLDSPMGTIGLLEPPEAVTRKIRRAVTDADTEVRYDRTAKPGVSNLLDVLGAVTDREPAAVAEHYDTYGALKADTAEAVIEALRPVQRRYADLGTDPAETIRLLGMGAAKARTVAAATYARAAAAIGLLAPSPAP